MPICECVFIPCVKNVYCKLYAIIFKFQNWDQIVLHKVQEDFTMYANSKSIPVMFSLHIDGQIN